MEESPYRETRIWAMPSDRWPDGRVTMIDIIEPTGVRARLGIARCIFCGYWANDGIKDLIVHFSREHGRVV